MIKAKKTTILFCAIMAAGFGFLTWVNSALADNTGTYTAVPKDAAVNGANWASFSWLPLNANQPTGTSVTMSVRSCTQSDCSDKSSWTGCSITNDGTLVGHACMTPGQRYVQYQATLNSTNNNIPEVQSVTVNYYYFNGSYSLLSSPYNATDPTNALGKIAWNESNVNGTTKDVKFQVRTATNNNNGTPGDPADDTPNVWFPAGGDFCGPDNGTAGTCNTGTYFSDPTGLSEVIDADMKGGTSDQWVQYKVYLSATSIWQTPSVQDATMSYVVNQSPVVSNVSASENPDGTISIGYDLADSDSPSATVSAWADIGVTLNEGGGTLLSSDTTAVTVSDATLLPTAGTIQIDNEQISYTAKNGNNLEGTITRGANETTIAEHTNTAVIWGKALTTAPGDNIGAGQTIGPGKTIAWTIKSDLDGAYNATGKIRVTANDGNLANQVSANGESDPFVIDVKNPNTPQISLNRSATPDKISATFNVTEDTADELEYVLDTTLDFNKNDGKSYHGEVETNCFGGASTPSAIEDYLTANSLTWSAFDTHPTAKTVTFSDDNDDVKKICVIFKDKYSNYLSNSGTSINYAVTPENPHHFEYYDTSNPDIGDFRLFFSWGIPEGDPDGYAEGQEKESGNWINGFDYYDIYSCSALKAEPDCTPTAHTTISSKNDNYLADTGLTDANRYCYKLRTKDNNPDNTAVGDYSQWSDTLCVVPSEGGSSLGENLSIHKDTIEVPDATRYATQVTINWNSYNAANPTALLTSTSRVYWKLPADVGWSFYEMPGYTPTHSVPIPGGQLEPNTTYQYKVYSETYWGTSDEVSTDEADDPLTFTTRDGPAISNVDVPIKGNTGATVTWDTSIAANATLSYSASVTDGEMDAPISTGTCPAPTVYETDHTCTIDGLAEGTTYYFSVRSEKEGDANAYAVHSFDTEGNFHSFETKTDSTPPDITPDVNNPLIVTDTQAAISWETDESAKSWLLYDTESNDAFDFPETDFDPTDPLQNPYTDYIPNTAPDYSHTFVMDLDSLDPNTQHFYRMVAEDTSGNVTVYAEDDFTTLQTQIDHPELIESSVADPTDDNEVLITDTEALIQYQTTTTPTHTTAKLCYATEQISDEDFTTCLTGNTSDAFHLISSDTTSIIHAFHLGSGAVGTDNPALNQDETYYYRIQVTDSEAPGNSFTTSDSAAINFTTLPDADLQHEPISGISDIEVLADFLTDTNAVITFNTDAASKCYAQVSAVNPRNPDTEIYANSITHWEDGYDEDKYNNSHSIHVTDLLFSTQHYFHLKCRDNLFDGGGSLEITSVENNFTTLEQQGADDDVTAPDITSVSVDTITGESATVKWTTDEAANSLVKYGITSGTYEGYGGDSTINDDITKYETGHTVIINGLIPGTKYYYKVISYDATGNFDESSESSFTTKSASTLSGIEATSIKLGEVTIAWKSSEKTTSVVYYGEKENTYTESKESSTYATDHSITISNLKSNVKYYYRVEGKDQNNNLYSSQGLSFTPKSPPQITAVKTNSTTEHEAVVTFTTSAPTDALIVYTNTEDKSDTGSQGKPDLLTSHSITLKNLIAGTTYSYIITAKDYDGNASTYPATGQSSPSFTTGVDTAPPKIDQIRTDSALAQNDKVQTIISWITDELSDTALIYKEGQNSEPKEVKVSSNPTTNHIAVITIFKPGTVYFFKTKSTDLAGNSATSTDFALLTPKRKENIIQIIISNFQEIFGWAKF